MGRRPKALIQPPPHPAPTNESSSPLKLENESQKKLSGLNVKKRISKEQSGAVRRSGRLQNIIRPSQNQSIVEQINLDESENEDEQQYEEQREIEFQDNTPEPEPEPIMDKSILEEKFSILVESVQQLKQEITENRPSTDLVYKSLYLDSQKKVEALRIESDQLREKLEEALLKLEAIDKAKEMMKQQMVNDMIKSNDAGTKKCTRAMK